MKLIDFFFVLLYADAVYKDRQSKKRNVFTFREAKDQFLLYFKFS